MKLEKTNLTLYVDISLKKEAEKKAVKYGTSLSELVRGFLAYFISLSEKETKRLITGLKKHYLNYVSQTVLENESIKE